MAIPYINFSTENHTGIILGQQQSIQRRMNLRPDWTEIRCVAMARVDGGNTTTDGIGNLDANLSTSVNALQSLNPTSPLQRFYFGVKDSSLSYPETSGTKFIGVGAGAEEDITMRFWSGVSYGSGSGGANQLVGLRYGAESNMRYGISVGENSLSTLKPPPNSSSAPNFRFQPVMKEYASATTEPSTGFVSSVGFTIKVSNRGTEEQQVTIFNYGSQTFTSTFNTQYTNYYRRFTSLDESVLDSEMNIMGNNINAHSGGLAHTFDAPHSQYDISGIDSFYIHWPFPTGRLMLFNLKIKDYTL